jgi:nucleoid-associated protein EbfC
MGEPQPDVRRDGPRPPRGASSWIRGSSAGGLVTVTVSTSGELLTVDVRPGDYQPHDPPGLDNMGDLLVEAFTDAMARASAAARESAEDPGLA